jgi:DNA mismatch repair protein MutS2
VRVASSSNSKGKTKEQSRHVSPGSSPPLPSSSINTGFYQRELDLRGIRLEEALEKTITALDQALMDQAKYVKIIHGQGSGALKTGIRQLCQSSPYTDNYRAGDPAEGGDGVTIIELR